MTCGGGCRDRRLHAHAGLKVGHLPLSGAIRTGCWGAGEEGTGEIGHVEVGAGMAQERVAPFGRQIVLIGEVGSDASLVEMVVLGIGEVAGAATLGDSKSKAGARLTKDR